MTALDNDPSGWGHFAFPDLDGLGPLERRMATAERQLAGIFDQHPWEEAVDGALQLFPYVHRSDLTQLWELAHECESHEAWSRLREFEWADDSYTDRLRKLVEQVQAAEAEQSSRRPLAVVR